MRLLRHFVPRNDGTYLSLRGGVANEAISIKNKFAEGHNTDFLMRIMKGGLEC